MSGDEVRKKYLEFFLKRGHKEISPSPLVLENDPTTLFTSSGMQPLVPYLMGEKHPLGKRLVDIQPAIRLQDIEEVGDNRHTTYFEMLGNWSLGDYFKEEQLKWFWEFLTSTLSLPKEKLWVSVFEGDNTVPKDEESARIWKEIGVPEERIFYYGVDKNWWSRSGVPAKMPAGEIGGPDSEVFFEFEGVKHDKKFGAKCHPNCDCGRFLEIGNSVFMEYKKTADGLVELPYKNVDFGGGLERLVAATENTSDVFATSLFKDWISKIEKVTGKKYLANAREFRIIADHMRASEALIKDGVVPENKMQGYVLRRLIRRATLKMRSLKGVLDAFDLALSKDKFVNKIVGEEVGRFTRSLEKGLREIAKIKKIDATKAFDLYQTYGFPLELTREIFEEKGQKIDKQKFDQEFLAHKEKSRTAAKGMFKGGLADNGSETTKLHTATHLLHESLRRVLGKEVSQKGSHITPERLRFDFSFPRAMTKKEIARVEKMINEEIGRGLPVTSQTMPFEKSQKEGALAFFKDKYEDVVKVYSIGDFSKEVCGGPHVSNTSEIGRVKIVKEQSSGSGVRRIYAKLV